MKVGIVDQIGGNYSVFEVAVLVLVQDVLAFPQGALFGFARELDTVCILFDTEFGNGHRVEIPVVDTLDVEVDIARQFEIQCQ